MKNQAVPRHGESQALALFFHLRVLRTGSSKFQRPVLAFLPRTSEKGTQVTRALRSSGSDRTNRSRIFLRDLRCICTMQRQPLTWLSFCRPFASLSVNAQAEAGIEKHGCTDTGVGMGLRTWPSGSNNNGSHAICRNSPTLASLG